MESSRDVNSQQFDTRAQALFAWLRNDCHLPPAKLQPMAGDASFRRYFRFQPSSQQSFVAMDAPPPREKCAPFIAVADALRAHGLATPSIIASDVEQGFLLLSDFGDHTYLSVLNVANADVLYGYALDALSVLQSCKHVPNHVLPCFTAAFMQQEWEWHKEWFLQKWLSLTPPATLDACFSQLSTLAAKQPQVFMHRDYHSANLMVLPTMQHVGILDFQDAFVGPVTYDVVSLLRDCYIAWPIQRVRQWAISYWQRLQLPHVSQDEFLHWFDWMGIERHLKALFTFSRKFLRDGQAQFLQHVPRTLNYILQVSSQYPELSALHDYYLEIVLPVVKQRLLTSCAP